MFEGFLIFAAVVLRVDSSTKGRQHQSTQRDSKRPSSLSLTAGFEIAKIENPVSRPIVLVHVPKSGGESFQEHYTSKGKSALGTALQMCTSSPESHWPRLQSGNPSYHLWQKLKARDCNFVPAHSTAQTLIADVVNVTGDLPFTITILRHPVLRAESTLAYGCKHTCAPWVPIPIRKHGLAALVDESVCDRNSTACWIPLKTEEGPLFGNLLTYYFANVQPLRAGYKVGKDLTGDLGALYSAEQRLHTLDVVMLLEEMHASACLLFWVGSTAHGLDQQVFRRAFDVECRINATINKERVSNASPHRTQLSEKFLRAYESVISNDLDLYEKGRRLFCEALGAMAKATGVAFPEAELLTCRDLRNN